MREALYRETYRGIVVWNQSRKRDTWGRKDQKARPEGEWLRVPVPALRIVSDALWTAAHERLASTKKEYLRRTDGRLWGKPQTGADAKYLLSGLAVCWRCGGSLTVCSRTHGTRRRVRKQFYVCRNARERGTCTNRAWLPMAVVDGALLSAIEEGLLTPQRMLAAVALARQQLDEQRQDQQVTSQELDARLLQLGTEIESPDGRPCSGRFVGCDRPCPEGS